MESSGELEAIPLPIFPSDKVLELTSQIYSGALGAVGRCGSLVGWESIFKVPFAAYCSLTIVVDLGNDGSSSRRCDIPPESTCEIVTVQVLNGCVKLRIHDEYSPDIYVSP